MGADQQTRQPALAGQFEKRRNIVFHKPSVAWLCARDNRTVFKLTQKLCEHEITPGEVKELLTQGKSPVIETSFPNAATNSLRTASSPPRKTKPSSNSCGNKVGADLARAFERNAQLTHMHVSPRIRNFRGKR
jgi:hypothetical protein